MRYGRALLAGLGWAGALGGAAVCVLIFLSGFLAFDGGPSAVEPRKAKILRLPAVPDAEVPRVRLRRPPPRLAGGGGTRSGSAPRAPTGGGVPRPRTTPRATVPVPTAPAGSPPPASAPPTAAPAPARPRPASPAGGGGGGAQSSPPPTLGNTTSAILGDVGTEVGRVSPPLGEAIQQTGDTVGDGVDTLVPRLPPLAPG